MVVGDTCGVHNIISSCEEGLPKNKGNDRSNDGSGKPYTTKTFEPRKIEMKARKYKNKKKAFFLYPTQKTGKIDGCEGARYADGKGKISGNGCMS